MRPKLISIFTILILAQATFSLAQDAYSKADRDRLIAKELDCVQTFAQENRPALWDKACQISEEGIPQPRSVQERLEAHMARIDAELAALNEADVTEREDSFAASSQPEFLNQKQPSGDFWGRILGRDNPLTKIDFGLELFGYDYREPHLMRQDGYFSGVFAAYTYRTNQNAIFNWADAFKQDSKINMFRLDARFSYGEVDYESEGTGFDNGIPNYIFETRGIAGYDMPLSEYFRITPYLGLGYRFLLSDGGGRRSTTGHFNYDRESNYYYLPVGIEFHNDHRNSWTTDFVLEYDLFLHGKQISRLEHGYGTLENNQQVGLGLRSSIKLSKTTEKVDYFVEPFVRYWHIDDSDVAISCDQLCIAGLEPDNKQYEYGLKAGLSY